MSRAVSIAKYREEDEEEIRRYKGNKFKREPSREELLRGGVEVEMHRNETCSGKKKSKCLSAEHKTRGERSWEKVIFLVDYIPTI